MVTRLVPTRLWGAWRGASAGSPESGSRMSWGSSSQGRSVSSSKPVSWFLPSLRLSVCLSHWEAGPCCAPPTAFLRWGPQPALPRVPRGLLSALRHLLF